MQSTCKAKREISPPLSGTRVVRAPYAHLQSPCSPPQRSEVAPLRPSRLTVGLQEAATVQLPQQHGYFFHLYEFLWRYYHFIRYAFGGNSSNSLIPGQWISNGRFRSRLMQKNATSYRCGSARALRDPRQARSVASRTPAAAARRGRRRAGRRPAPAGAARTERCTLARCAERCRTGSLA